MVHHACERQLQVGSRSKPANMGRFGVLHKVPKGVRNVWLPEGLLASRLWTGAVLLLTLYGLCQLCICCYSNTSTPYRDNRAGADGVQHLQGL